MAEELRQLFAVVQTDSQGGEAGGPGTVQPGNSSESPAAEDTVAMSEVVSPGSVEPLGSRFSTADSSQPSTSPPVTESSPMAVPLNDPRSDKTSPATTQVPQKEGNGAFAPASATVAAAAHHAGEAGTRFDGGWL